ncbi:hypothetical protein BPT24_212 [Tenacibaculum phage pT24]|uniref:Uncharacterized protein n=1 Tax=Tenacibaculum phage pT24 TaxID=1880590 RepID=A0A1B4XWZ2_9CAUD|nr:hypothetical protein HYP10_gp212 [Tenacibaculum phage pT24]BAV39336.1 hypothetical protein BPT24_212 [Tenacibaculum phage pT24]
MESNLFETRRKEVLGTVDYELKEPFRTPVNLEIVKKGTDFFASLFEEKEIKKAINRIYSMYEFSENMMVKDVNLIPARSVLKHNTEYNYYKQSLSYIFSWLLIRIGEGTMKNESETIQRFKNYIEFRKNKIISEMIERTPSFNSTCVMSNMKEIYENEARAYMLRNIFLPISNSLNGKIGDTTSSISVGFPTSNFNNKNC